MVFKFEVKPMEWLHYALVFGVLLAVWLPVMNAVGGNVTYTSLIVFAIFVATDKLAHKIFGLK